MERASSAKTVRVFAVASFLNDFGSDIIYPIWPLFVTTTLGANTAILGLIDGLGEAVVSVSQAASGYLSDRIQRRKIFIWLGYAFGSLSRIGYALSSVWQQVLPFRVFDRMGKIRGAPRDAIIADVSGDENRGKNFGLLRSMDNLGAVCGILFCLAFIDIGYQNLFLIASVPSAVAVVLILSYVRDPERSATKAFKGLSLRRFNKNLTLTFVSGALFALGAFSYSFLLLYAGDLGLSASLMPVLYLVFTVVAALLSFPFGRLADLVGRKPILLAGYACWGFTCLGFLTLGGILGAILCFISYGVHKAAMEPVQKALVSELSPEGLRASTLGSFQMVIGLCAFPSSFVAGLLWSTVDKLAPLQVSILLTIASGVVLLFVRENDRRIEEQSTKVAGSYEPRT